MMSSSWASAVLKVDNLIAVVFVGYGENVIMSLRGVAHLIVDGAVVKKSVLLHLVSVSVKAEQESWIHLGVKVERLGHVVVKLLRVGWCVHAQHRSVEAFAVFRRLLLHEVEVWHGPRVVIFYGVGVKTHKLDASGNETEVGVAKDHLIALVARAQTVVVAEQRHERHCETLQQVTAPLKLARAAKVGYVASVYHKVDAVLSSVYVSYLGLRFIEPLVRVADEGKANGVLAKRGFFYQCHLLGVHAFLAFHPHIVRMHVEHFVACREQHGH